MLRVTAIAFALGCLVAVSGADGDCNEMNMFSEKSSSSCRRDNTTEIECSSHGVCVCGECKCESSKDGLQRFYGKYCECNNFSCERNNQLLCSGPDHGTCECGQCQCKPEWEGTACECLKSKESCMPPKGGEICSGHGECRCGECKCKVTEEGRYSGKYCEKCPTCSGRCHELKDCVQCQMYNLGPLNNAECLSHCDSFVPVGVEKVVIDENLNEQLCIFYDEDDCVFRFKYSEENDKLFVHTIQERECPVSIFSNFL